MNVIDIREFEDTFVIQFGTKYSNINVYTLASALVAVADAAKAANAAINPGYELEVVVEAVEPGSFKAKVRAIYQGADNLFSKESLKSIVFGVIASYIYNHTLAPDQAVNVTVNTNEVIVQQGDTRLVIPREVHEAALRVEQNPEFRSGISRAFQSIESDPGVSYVAATGSAGVVPPGNRIPRDRFASLSEITSMPEAGVREVTEIANLQITRAILERGRKRWQFVWRGMRISAPVVDDNFYRRFFAHEITVAPGDVLKVRLRVRQRHDIETGVVINDPNGYEVVEVLDHRPRARQDRAPV